MHKEIEETYDPSEFLPDVGDADYMVRLFYEAGIWMQTGMGGVALTWTEIKNWLDCTELELSYWEIATIRNMSVSYVSEFNQASDKQREAPYTAIQAEVDEEEVGAKVADVLRSLKSKHRN